jgi:hypothetical protein
VTRLPQTLQGQFPLSFLCRTFEAFFLSFENDTEASDVFDSVKELTVARESSDEPSHILNLTLGFVQPQYSHSMPFFTIRTHHCQLIQAGLYILPVRSSVGWALDQDRKHGGSRI